MVSYEFKYVVEYVWIDLWVKVSSVMCFSCVRPGIGVGHLSVKYEFKEV